MIRDAMKDRNRTYRVKNRMLSPVGFKDDTLQWLHTDQPFVLNNNSLNYRWERVMKSVTFMEALKQYRFKDKDIMCFYQGEYIVFNSADRKYTTFTVNQIINGIWYIREV